MYRTDTIAASAATWLQDGRIPEDLAATIRRDLGTEDRANGRLYGLQDVFIMLYEGSWPKTGAERDELCRCHEITTRSLYQWRRDVLLVVAFALADYDMRRYLRLVTDAVTNTEPKKPQE